MHISSVDIGQFRNISLAHVEFSRGFNVFYGDNAQGKSNFLEALYTLAFLKGFRADRLGAMVNFSQSCAQLGAVVETQDGRRRLSLEIGEKRRRAFVDGVACTRMSEYLGILRATLFVPSDVAMLQHAPEQRRKMLDRMVFTMQPSYLLDLENYQKVCKQKSAALKAEVPDIDLLDAFDAQLYPLGERMLQGRYRYLSRLVPYVRRCFADIFDDQLTCSLFYHSSTMKGDAVCGTDQDDVLLEQMVAAYRAYRAKSREKELVSQQVLRGPHRDDWSIQIDGHSAKYFASQGQQRALSLAIKIAEIECLKNEVGVEPIFLLDDVSSELDPTRHKKLYERLNRLTSQVFLTTTALEHVHLENVARLYRVESGRIYDES